MSTWEKKFTVPLQARDQSPALLIPLDLQRSGNTPCIARLFTGKDADKFASYHRVENFPSAENDFQKMQFLFNLPQYAESFVKYLDSKLVLCAEADLALLFGSKTACLTFFGNLEDAKKVSELGLEFFVFKAKMTQSDGTSRASDFFFILKLGLTVPFQKACLGLLWDICQIRLMEKRARIFGHWWTANQPGGLLCLLAQLSNRRSRLRFLRFPVRPVRVIRYSGQDEVHYSDARLVSEFAFDQILYNDKRQQMFADLGIPFPERNPPDSTLAPVIVSCNGNSSNAAILSQFCGIRPAAQVSFVPLVVVLPDNTQHEDHHRGLSAIDQLAWALLLQVVLELYQQKYLEDVEERHKAMARRKKVNQQRAQPQRECKRAKTDPRNDQDEDADKMDE